MGEATTFPLIVYSMAGHGTYIQMVFLSHDYQVGVPKLRQLGLPWLWKPITLLADLGSRCGLKQSCSSRRELFKGMSHAFCSQVNRVDSRLFLVRSQTGSLIPDPSFGHNLCFRCPNEQCETILDIYVPRTFQWYKKRHKPLSFDLWNCSLKFHLPKWELPWECEGSLPHTPSHFLTLSGVCDVIPGLLLGPHPCDLFALTLGLPLDPQPCNPFALVASPKLGLQHA